MSIVRWGIISTANIGTEQVIPAIQAASNCEVVAIASRNAEKARAAASDLGIANSYDSYEALLNDSTIDAVYVPLPNHMHAEWTLKAAAAGKHILCEKPLAMNAAQAQQMVDGCESAGVLLMDAFMYRLHPLWTRTLELIAEGRIGDLMTVQSFFSYYNDDPQNIRNIFEVGGGAVMDVGCYNINLSRMLFGSEPVSIKSSVQRDPASGVDVLTSGLLEFKDGGQATFTCGTRLENYQRVKIVGTSGMIEIEIPFNIPKTIETRILVTAGGNPPVSPNTEVITFAPVNQYTIQAELFANAVLTGGTVPTPPSDGVANMAVIDAILG